MGNRVGSGGSSRVQVAFFSPVSDGTKSATLTITDTASGSPQRVGLTGTGTPPAGLLLVSPPSLFFGTVAPGSQSGPGYVGVSNSGNVAVTLTSIAVTGGEAHDFIETNNCGASVALAAACNITVTFSPVSVGAKSAAPIITDSASGSPQRVVLTGTGGNAAMVVVGVSALSFAGQLAGTTSSSQTVSLYNSGSIPVVFAGISVTGAQADDFSESNNCGATLAAYASCVVLVTFKPVSSGSKAATLSVVDNAVGSPQRVALSGVGLPLPPLGLNSIFPSAVFSGGSGFVLTTVGQGFLPNAVVLLDGAPLPTTYVSETQLQAAVPATDIAATGTAAITVQNTTGTGGNSAPLTLNINVPMADSVTFQITTQHSGAVTFNTLALPTQSKWSVDVGGTPSYAVIVEGKVVVTVAFGNATELFALDQATGSTVWGPFELAGAANAAYDGGKIFVVSGAFGTPALLESLDLATGHSDWTTFLADEQYFSASGVTALNGFVFTAGAGELFAINAATGATGWSQFVQDGEASVPAVTNQGVYVSYPCWTYAFHPPSGTSLFSNNTGCDGGGGGTPVVANNVLYSPNEAGTYNGATFNATTGTLLGAYIADVPPAIGTDMGFFLQSGNLVGIALSSNTVLWHFTGDGSLVTSPILINQTVIVGSSTGNLYGLNAVTGQQVWTINAGGAIPVGATWGTAIPLNALAAGDGLLVVPAGHRVVAYTLSTTP